MVLSSGRVVASATEFGSKSTLLVQAWDPDGTVAWTYRYPDLGDQSWEKASKLATDGSFIYVVGTKSLTPTVDDDTVLVVKLSQSGTFLGDISFGVGSGGGDEVVCGVSLNRTTDNEFYITGYTSYGLPTLHTGWVAKTDSSLNFQWHRELTYETRVTPTAPLALPDGRVLVPSEGDSAGITYRTALAKYSPTGVLEATMQVPNTTGMVQPLARMDSGQLFFCVNNGAGVQVSKLDANLGLLGTILVDDHFYARSSVLWSEAAQALYVCSDRYAEDLVDVRKYSASGVLQWVDTPSNEIFGLGHYILKADVFGNPVVVGNTIRGNGNIDFVAWCWDAAGHRQYRTTLDGTQTSNDVPNSFTLDDQLRLVAVGRAINPSDTGDYKGAAWRTTQFFHRSPDSVAMRLGSLVSGGVQDLEEVDGVTQVLRAPQGSHGSNMEVIVAEFDTVYPIEMVDPSMTLEAKINLSCNTSNGLAVLQLFDWSARAWRMVWNSNVSTAPQTFTAGIVAPQRYIRPGTRMVRARLALAPLRKPATLFNCTLDMFELRSDT